MANGNNVTIVGNLTRDPELRFTPSGQATTTFGVAVNRRWQNRQTQEWDEATSYFDVVCWAQMAENVAQSLGRGSRVVVSGRLDQRSWENSEGEKRSKIEITADEIAPSLRWATVSITKNERRSPDGGGSNGSPGGGDTRPPSNYGSGGAAPQSPANATQTPEYQYEEEPF
ncbi:MAG: single-stranded DNA-binding protein [Actinomycetota bacterium]|nr:single-stranded DNA-binding protein [Actinomycetota bacterium]